MIIKWWPIRKETIKRVKNISWPFFLRVVYRILIHCTSPLLKNFENMTSCVSKKTNWFWNWKNWSKHWESRKRNRVKSNKCNWHMIYWTRNIKLNCRIKLILKNKWTNSLFCRKNLKVCKSALKEPLIVPTKQITMASNKQTEWHKRWICLMIFTIRQSMFRL